MTTDTFLFGEWEIFHLSAKIWGGDQICLQPNSSNSQLTGFNDEASSIIIFKTATVC